MEKFKLKHLPSLLWQAAKNWMEDEPFRLSAVVAYYAILSLPAFMVILINTVGAIWGVEIVQGNLTGEITEVLGKDVAQSVETMIRETQQPNKNTISTIIGIGTLIVGSTGVFYHLQISLNQIWKIETDGQNPIWQTITNRARSFLFILIIGFLLLISFVLTALVSLLTDFIQQNFTDIVLYLTYLIDISVSLGVITVLFALIFKYLPNAKIKWGSVWMGAFITAILFVLGKFLLGLYFGRANFDSTYGAAGTLVLILLWVSYSCLILFYGAEFTYVYAQRYGLGVRPTKHSKELGP